MDNFNQKVDRSGDCWMWLAGLDKDGYGKINIGGKTLRTHRVAWELASNKKIPDELIVMHTCDVPGCVNPAHLRLGTVAQNNQDREAKGRGRYRNMTHCPQGHKYTEESTSINPQGHRKCKICVRDRGRKQYYIRKVRQSELPRNCHIKQTHCPHGHELTIENTHFRIEGGFRCRVCMREYDRNRRKKSRERKAK